MTHYAFIKEKIFGHNLKALACEDNLPTFLMHSLTIFHY